ncbi:MAG: 30S ribosomal protein S8 [Planctomycetota bacterium]|nr:MAG: 30S ribosomal protein S8 [Planctomycetota bacterium]
MMTDPISDMLTRIRNGIQRKKNKVFCPYSKLKEGILKVLKAEGFILGYQILEPKRLSYKILQIQLKYDENGRSPISVLKRESKPGRRIYKSVNEIRKVMNGYGLGIYSTSKGLLSDRECRLKRVGGEYICSVY